jgi:hypothetical protein
MPEQVRHRSRLLPPELLFLSIVIASFALHGSGVRERLDAVALDATQRTLRALAPVPSPDSVLIVGIDAETAGRGRRGTAYEHIARPARAAGPRSGRRVRCAAGV